MGVFIRNSRWDIIRPYIRDKKVLDLGVVQHYIKNYESEFWMHKLIVEEAKFCLGVDIASEGVEFLNKKGYKVTCADATQFDLGETFDVIFAGELIEHLSDFKGFLNSVKKHLSPDGILILSTPNPFFFRRFFEALVKGKVDVNSQHICWFCETTIKQLLGRHDFRIHNVVYHTRELWYRILPLPKILKHRGIV